MERHGLKAGRHTPTCVGKIISASIILRLKTGTPPHAWGRFHFVSRSADSGRYTPTCVGKIAVYYFAYGLIRVHPHMRGEDRCGTGSPSFAEGTPPHAWGRFTRCFTFISSHGYTPTCVGKILRQSCIQRSVRVHPHMRGEDT